MISFEAKKAQLVNNVKVSLFYSDFQLIIPMSSGFVRIRHLDTLYVYCLIIPLVLLLSLLILILLLLFN